MGNSKENKTAFRTYQPPITFNPIINPGEWADNVLLKGIIDLGIKVDKEELLKALKYDRDQYNKGYEDGYKAGVKSSGK